MARLRQPHYRPTRAGTHAIQHGDIVLVIEDDASIRRSLYRTLNRHGYRAIEAESSMDIDVLVGRIRPIVILIDADRSFDEALASIARLREWSATPVIVLSTRCREGDKIVALDAGADDYVTKPFGTSELLARIRVASRHARGHSTLDGALQVGPIRIDHARYQVTVNGIPIHLTPIEYRLLTTFARHADKVLTRDQLLHEVWGPDEAQPHYVRVYVATLRNKIERDPAHPRWLETVKRVGYRLRVE